MLGDNHLAILAGQIWASHAGVKAVAKWPPTTL
jgi:hypothetical protein